MRKFTLSIIMIAACGLLHAQSLSPTVISSAGGFFESAAGKLSFTVGEPMVETYIKTANILTQGFQQPFDYVAAVQEPTRSSFAFGVFPNPSSGRVNLVLNSKTNAVVNVRLIDAVGKTVTSDRFTHAAGVNTYAYNWNQVSNGMYMVEVTITDQATNTTQKSMKKINIIY